MKRCACIIFLLVHVCVHMKIPVSVSSRWSDHSFCNVLENVQYAFSEQQVLWSRATQSLRPHSVFVITAYMHDTKACVMMRH